MLEPHEDVDQHDGVVQDDSAAAVQVVYASFDSEAERKAVLLEKARITAANVERIAESIRSDVDHDQPEFSTTGSMRGYGTMNDGDPEASSLLEAPSLLEDPRAASSLKQPDSIGRVRTQPRREPAPVNASSHLLPSSAPRGRIAVPEFGDGARADRENVAQYCGGSGCLAAVNRTAGRLFEWNGASFTFGMASAFAITAATFWVLGPLAQQAFAQGWKDYYGVEFADNITTLLNMVNMFGRAPLQASMPFFAIPAVMGSVYLPVQVGLDFLMACRRPKDMDASRLSLKMIKHARNIGLAFIATAFIAMVFSLDKMAKQAAFDGPQPWGNETGTEFGDPATNVDARTAQGFEVLASINEKTGDLLGVAGSWMLPVLYTVLAAAGLQVVRALLMSCVTNRNWPSVDELMLENWSSPVAKSNQHPEDKSNDKVSWGRSIQDSLASLMVISSVFYFLYALNAWATALHGGSSWLLGTKFPGTDLDADQYWTPEAAAATNQRLGLFNGVNATDMLAKGFGQGRAMHELSLNGAFYHLTMGILALQTCFFLSSAYMLGKNKVVGQEAMSTTARGIKTLASLLSPMMMAIAFLTLRAFRNLPEALFEQGDLTPAGPTNGPFDDRVRQIVKAGANAAEVFFGAIQGWPAMALTGMFTAPIALLLVVSIAACIRSCRRTAPAVDALNPVYTAIDDDEFNDELPDRPAYVNPLYDALGVAGELFGMSNPAYYLNTATTTVTDYATAGDPGGNRGIMRRRPDPLDPPPTITTTTVVPADEGSRHSGASGIYHNEVFDAAATYGVWVPNETVPGDPSPRPASYMELVPPNRTFVFQHDYQAQEGDQFLRVGEQTYEYRRAGHDFEAEVHVSIDGLDVTVQDYVNGVFGLDNQQAIAVMRAEVGMQDGVHDARFIPGLSAADEVAGYVEPEPGAIESMAIGVDFVAQEGDRYMAYRNGHYGVVRQGARGYNSMLTFDQGGDVFPQMCRDLGMDAQRFTPTTCWTVDKALLEGMAQRRDRLTFRIVSDKSQADTRYFLINSNDRDYGSDLSFGLDDAAAMTAMCIHLRLSPDFWANATALDLDDALLSDTATEEHLYLQVTPDDHGTCTCTLLRAGVYDEADDSMVEFVPVLNDGSFHEQGGDQFFDVTIDGQHLVGCIRQGVAVPQGLAMTPDEPHYMTVYPDEVNDPESAQRDPNASRQNADAFRQSKLYMDVFPDEAQASLGSSRLSGGGSPSLLAATVRPEESDDAIALLDAATASVPGLGGSNSDGAL